MQEATPIGHSGTELADLSAAGQLKHATGAMAMLSHCCLKGEQDWPEPAGMAARVAARPEGEAAGVGRGLVLKRLVAVSAEMVAAWLRVRRDAAIVVGVDHGRRTAMTAQRKRKRRASHTQLTLCYHLISLPMYINNWLTKTNKLKNYQIDFITMIYNF